MSTLWFGIVAIMFAIYATLDGFDMGVGIVYLFIAHEDAERKEVLASIGPVWDGNEVWLLAAGGTLFFAFPAAYASAFSGFYLPLMMVLWLLILRGTAVEFRNRIVSPVWAPLWDVVFSGASALLALFFGAALGNVLRGVPLDANGNFFLPLWTDFRINVDAGVLDWFTIILGLASVAVLAMHGALWLAVKTTGALQARARILARVFWIAVAAVSVLLILMVPLILPQFGHRFMNNPWGLVFPIVAFASLAGIMAMTSAARDTPAFLCSCAYILSMLTAAVFGHYPYLLSPIAIGQPALTILNASTSDVDLTIALYWFIPGVALVIAYFVFAYRTLFAHRESNSY
ncbi:MAG TPA: cytochrome d ubiquinol oxidase subunit II [Candidatus Binataceae bacterium]|nr:cytochrome d ubiquinol oxidase subunit II [Candidatus Binataceae bacterium]